MIAIKIHRQMKSLMKLMTWKCLSLFIIKISLLVLDRFISKIKLLLVKNLNGKTLQFQTIRLKNLKEILRGEVLSKFNSKNELKLIAEVTIYLRFTVTKRRKRSNPRFLKWHQEEDKHQHCKVKINIDNQKQTTHHVLILQMLRVERIS